MNYDNRLFMLKLSRYKKPITPMNKKGWIILTILALVILWWL